MSSWSKGDCSRRVDDFDNYSDDSVKGQPLKNTVQKPSTSLDVKMKPMQAPMKAPKVDLTPISKQVESPEALPKASNAVLTVPKASNAVLTVPKASNAVLTVPKPEKPAITVPKPEKPAMIVPKPGKAPEEDSEAIQKAKFEAWINLNPKIDTFHAFSKAKREELLAKRAQEEKEEKERMEAEAKKNPPVQYMFRPRPLESFQPTPQFRIAEKSSKEFEFPKLVYTPNFIPPSPEQCPLSRSFLPGPLAQTTQVSRTVFSNQVSTNALNINPSAPSKELAQPESSAQPDTTKEPASTSHHCCSCLTVVPHNQLYVCALDSCSYCMKAYIINFTPHHFFRAQKLFCGTCAFRGCHSAHSRSMHPALPIAIESASGEVGATLVDEFRKSTMLDHTDPIDYLIAAKVTKGRLEDISLVEYLGNAQSVVEWDDRLAAIKGVMARMAKVREEGARMINDLADKALSFYHELSESVDYDLHTRKKKDAEVKKMRLQEHASNMGLPPDYYSRDSPIRAHNAPSLYSTPAAIEHVLDYVEQQSRLLEQPYIEDPVPSNLEELEEVESLGISESLGAPKSYGRPAEEPWSDTMLIKQRVDLSGTQMIYKDLFRRFESVRDEMSIEAALQNVSDLLNSKGVAMELKNAAAKVFKEKTNMALYWPPPEPEKKENQGKNPRKI